MSEYGIELSWFQYQMAQKLERNRHKGSWRNQSLRWLRNRLNIELKELDRALAKRKQLISHDIISECADVANFAMMIADSVRDTTDDEGCLIISEDHL